MHRCDRLAGNVQASHGLIRLVANIRQVNASWRSPQDRAGPDDSSRNHQGRVDRFVTVNANRCMVEATTYSPGDPVLERSATKRPRPCYGPPENESGSSMATRIPCAPCLVMRTRIALHAAPLQHPIYSHGYPCRLPFPPLCPVDHPAGAETAQPDPSQPARSDPSRDPSPKSQSESAGLIRVSRPDPTRVAIRVRRVDPSQLT
jgi:hypothetical protein